MIDTAPVWSYDRVGWCCWYLANNPQVYIAYRDLADEYRKDDPLRRCSSDLFFNVLRYFSVVKAWGDDFSLNNNAKSLFARLYVLERPDAVFENRASWVDDLSEPDWTAIFEVFAVLNDTVDVPSGNAPADWIDDLFDSLPAAAD